MERKTKKKTGSSAESYQEAYKTYVLTKGHAPVSVYQFCQEQGTEEADFYQYFSHFDAVEQSIWKAYVQETVQVLEADSAYAEYSGREKLLSFYYTLIEVLKKNRSFVLYSLKDVRKTDLHPTVLREARKHFLLFLSTLLGEAQAKEEVVSRPLIGEKYADALWVQFRFILDFWKNDSSAQFEKTDQAIEKSVNVSFDLMGKSALDGLFDLAKFLYQNR
ncbi:TetR family transcriptional regulator C-terminal domain-containing protein [Cytophagales bacterium LB-30]|uniref:TetR family transcriptional regulator C-terminal domain-containing protein n=1 Tax=Shiella aurantiaca TaxID=3058365 RepID=A0ABT8F1G9_9BACT|nr:TetR family transcriptional regulator C-terminal domain-containing protein [Shiella aurantiaca]MDN4164228.1 TetR family transcriptional regulator C-terminal domain-containing protein [Shiella aurantiaca]